MTEYKPSPGIKDIIEKLKGEIFTRGKYRFEWIIIHDKIYLVDNMLDWLKYLNKED